MKESDMMNNANTHTYMQAAVNVLFTHINTIFGERDKAVMIKELKQLDEREIQLNIMVLSLNPDKIIEKERRQALDAVNLI